MKRTYKIVISLIVLVLIALGLFSMRATGVDFLTSSQIFNQIFDNTTKSARISLNVESMKDSTALTNAVTYPVTLTHETSGTPAANIGVGLEFEQETSAGNNEAVMSLDAVIDDVTSTNEDASFSVKLMAAGAAKAEKFAVESTGVVTLVNGETLDNTVDGSVTLTGDFYVNGTQEYKTCTIADGDATPDVAGCQILTTSANTGATAITDLDNPVVGSVLYLIGGSDTNSSTIADSGNFALSDAWTAAADDVLILFVQADNDYIELGRVNN